MITLTTIGAKTLTCPTRSEDVIIAAIAKQTVEMFAEIGTDTVQRYGIYARIGVGQNKAENPENVPRIVEILPRAGVEMKPQEKDVHWQEANGKKNDEILKYRIHRKNTKLMKEKKRKIVRQRIQCAQIIRLTYLHHLGNFDTGFPILVRLKDTEGVEIVIIF